MSATGSMFRCIGKRASILVDFGERTLGDVEADQYRAVAVSLEATLRERLAPATVAVRLGGPELRVQAISGLHNTPLRIVRQIAGYVDDLVLRTAREILAGGGWDNSTVPEPALNAARSKAAEANFGFGEIRGDRLLLCDLGHAEELRQLLGGGFQVKPVRDDGVGMLAVTSISVPMLTPPPERVPPYRHDRALSAKGYLCFVPAETGVNQARWGRTPKQAAIALAPALPAHVDPKEAKILAWSKAPQHARSMATMILLAAAVDAAVELGFARGSIINGQAWIDRHDTDPGQRALRALVEEVEPGGFRVDVFAQYVVRWEPALAVGTMDARTAVGGRRAR